GLCSAFRAHGRLATTSAEPPGSTFSRGSYMLRSRVAAVAGTVCLVLGAASCGNGGEENGPFDAGLSGSDAGQASDAGQQLDGGAHEPDAGGNDEPDGGDVIP